MSTGNYTKVIGKLSSDSPMSDGQGVEIVRSYLSYLSVAGVSIIHDRVE